MCQREMVLLCHMKMVLSCVIGNYCHMSEENDTVVSHENGIVMCQVKRI